MSFAPLLFILGTRSEAIKAIPVIRALASRHPEIRVRIGATGQHAMIFDQIVEIEGVKPAWNLEVMRPRQQIPQLLGRLLRQLESPIRHEAPRLIAVVGDSASTLAAALAAHAAQAPLVHLEAGLRGARKGHPYPEGAFRRMISTCAAMSLAPTEEARRNLLREGIDPSAIEVVGDPGLDALAEKLAGDPSLDDPELHGVDWDRPLALVTVVRRENHGPGAHQICHALRRLVQEEPELQVVFPLSLNPHLMEPARSLLAGAEGIRSTLPLPHQLFVNVLRRANLAITDSGGVHEEASALGVPVVSLRASLDRGRLLGSGKIIEAGNREDAIVSAARNVLHRRGGKAQSSRTLEAFAPASPRIADRLAALVNQPP